MEAGQQQQQQVTTVCCGCRGGGGGGGGRVGGGGGMSSQQQQKQQRRRRQTIYHDASAPEDHPQAGAVVQVREKSDFFYFDAEQEELEDELYPIITTVSVAKAPLGMSILQPESLLRPEGEREEELEEKKIAAAPAPPRRHGQSVFRRSRLEAPRVRIVERGYPGELDQAELDQCLHFRREIQKRPACREIVSALAAVEEEPYALCRFMRAVRFKADAMVERLEAGTQYWTEAKERDFYPDLERAIGCPLPLFMHVYPYTYQGNARNGCPVSYFKAGRINSEGIFCLTTLAQAPAFFWNLLMHKFPANLQRARAKDPDFVRCESIQVTDMAGISRSQFNADAIEVIKIVSKISEYFPETLHCMIIVNAPGWFAMAWGMIRGFIDPRTAKKIEVYSRAARGAERLLELVDPSQVPSDFGGAAPTMTACMQQNEDSGRHHVEVVDLAKQKRKGVDMVELKEGESASVTVYTRSISACTVAVFCSGKQVTKDIKVSRESPTQFTEENPPTPFKTEIVAAVAGPGKIVVQLESLGHCSVSKKLPQGIFLIAATVQS